MPIPTFDEMMYPILELLDEGKEYELDKVRVAIGGKLGLTTADRSQLYSNGKTIFNDRFNWAKTYLTKAGLLEKVSRGSFKITPAGVEYRESKRKKGETKITVQELSKRFPEFGKWISSVRSAESPSKGDQPGKSQQPSLGSGPAPSGSSTPQDALEEAFRQLDAKLLADLEAKLVAVDYTQFEVLITRLLVKMGYANSEEDIVQRHGGSGDGGIDGKVRKDPLGLEQVYHQAKRWSSAVGLKHVTDFFELVNDSKARTGVFVARTGFQKDAQEYIEKPIHRQNVAWLDGHKLAELMIKYRVGVTAEERGRYLMLSIDENAFVPEED